MVVAATDLQHRTRQAWGPAMNPAAELPSSNAVRDWRATVAKWQLTQSDHTRAAEGCLSRCCYCCWFLALTAFAFYTWITHWHIVIPACNSNAVTHTHHIHIHTETNHIYTYTQCWMHAACNMNAHTLKRGVELTCGMHTSKHTMYCYIHTRICMCGCVWITRLLVPAKTCWWWW